MRLHPLPALGDNYIWILAADDGACLVVDPGEAGPVLRAADEGLRPVAVLLTHHHADHIGGTAALRQRWPELAVFAPDDARIPEATVRVGNGDTLAPGGWRFQVIAIPGHTASHIAFVSEDAAHGGPLFCGDTLFSLGCGRMFEGAPPQMLASLDRLAALPDPTQVCCGHEYTLANAAFASAVEPDNPALARRAAQAAALRAAGRPTLPATLGEERAANPFLRVDAPAVRARVAARLGREPRDRVEVFAELRRWKDGFAA
jgi:hydroxyacylglutathione hydrolase